MEQYPQRYAYSHEQGRYFQSQYTEQQNQKQRYVKKKNCNCGNKKKIRIVEEGTRFQSKDTQRNPRDIGF